MILAQVERPPPCNRLHSQAKVLQAGSEPF